MRGRFNLLITILLLVSVPPMISVGEFQVIITDHLLMHNDNILFLITANQLVGAYEGQQIKLECHSEAYPKSINYWTKEKGDIVPQGE